MSEELAMERLVNIGFREVGKWRLEGDAPHYELREFAASRNILYAFVSRGQVLYLGKTVTALKKRLYGYEKPGPTQSTNEKVCKNIKDHLSKGEPVDIYALPDNGLLHYGGFHVNLAAGLEDSMIRKLQPVWNRRGK